MKELHIIRHAKTERIQPNQRDYDRALTERGQLQCSDLVNFLLGFSQEVDLSLVSAAKRTQMTYDALRPILNGKKTLILPELYLASATEIMEIIKDLAGDSQCVALIGHNDGLSDLVSYFLDDYQHVPTSGYMHLEFEVEDWNHIVRGSGVLIKHFFSQMR
jgi:phosphohistidine phosphatase